MQKIHNEYNIQVFNRESVLLIFPFVSGSNITRTGLILKYVSLKDKKKSMNK